MSAIRLYPDALDLDTCASLIEKFEHCAQVRRGVLGKNNYQPDVKRCSEIGLTEAGWTELDGRVAGGLSRALSRYADDVKTLRFGSNKLNDTGYLLQKYAKGESSGLAGGFDGFGWHSDVNDLYSSSRFLAMIMYLNTVHEGGETEFMDGTIVKPVAGSILFFPPHFEYTHRGLTPLSGPKYILTSFLVYGFHPEPVRSAVQQVLDRLPPEKSAELVDNIAMDLQTLEAKTPNLP